MMEDTLPTLEPRVSERDHIQGSIYAPVALVEYGDYECPYCGKAYWMIRELQKRLGDKMCFVFRNFPLSKSHPHSEDAAEAAEDANAQGKFWEMHDQLYENREALDRSDLVSYARKLGLDQSRFERDLLSRHHHSRIRADFMSGVRSGVNGTPTFFINGYRYDGPLDVDALERSLLAAMDEGESAA